MNKPTRGLCASDTPETDACTWHAESNGHYPAVVSAEFARNLERRLHEAEAEVAKLDKTARELLDNAREQLAEAKRRAGSGHAGAVDK